LNQYKQQEKYPKKGERQTIININFIYIYINDKIKKKEGKLTFLLTVDFLEYFTEL